MNFEKKILLFLTLTGCFFNFSFANDSSKKCANSSLLVIIQKGLESLDEIAGANFLHEKNPKKHMTFDIQRSEKILRKLKLSAPTEPTRKILTWFAILKQTHRSAQKNPKTLERIRKYYYRKYVIDEQNIPESHFRLQQKIYKERGFSYVTFSEADRSKAAKNIIADQKKSFDPWFEYLVSPDTDNYPTWAKVWIFESFVALGKFDLKSFKFEKRQRSSVAPFAELNRAALSKAFDVMKRKLNNESMDKLDQSLINASEKGKFVDLYTAALKLELSKNVDLTITEGQWKKYDKGSSPEPLIASLDCKNTNWCTVGKETAKNQLMKGDMYVYYSNDYLGNPVNPRVAIRMIGDDIAEVRGVGYAQNPDIEIAKTSIIENKLKAFGKKGEKYLKRSHDMTTLSLISQKHEEGKALSKEDLRFLYQIDAEIERFGYGEDARRERVLAGRNRREDLAIIFDTKPENISTTKDQAISGGIKYHDGGDLDLSNLESADGVELPEYFKYSIHLWNLKSAKGLKLPKYVGNKLRMWHLMVADGLILPEYIGGELVLGNLKSADGLICSKELFPKFSSAVNKSIWDNHIKIDKGSYYELKKISD